MEHTENILDNSLSLPSDWTSFFNQTSLEIAENDNTNTFLDVNGNINDYFNIDFAIPGDDPQPKFNLPQPMMASSDHIYHLEPGKLLEIGKNVTVIANSQEPLTVVPKVFPYDENFSLLSPFATNFSSKPQDLVNDDVFLSDYVEHSSSLELIDEHSFDLIDVINNNSQQLNSINTQSDSDPFEPVKKGRGRPRSSPDVHLEKLTGRVTKKEKKKLKNNAASIKYRHRKASEKENLQKTYQREKTRNEALKCRLDKLASDINQIKLLTRFDML